MRSIASNSHGVPMSQTDFTVEQQRAIRRGWMLPHLLV